MDDVAGRLVTVTGAAGFVGRAVVRNLSQRGAEVRAIVRRSGPVEGAAAVVQVGELLEADTASLVSGAWGVVNCAARVHQKWENEGGAAQAYERMNRHFPLALAQAANEAGCRRFVQLSSLAALASTSSPGEAIDDETPPRPAAAYGQSKLAADTGLLEKPMGAMAVACLRPPALLGADAPGWAPLLARAARKGLPLPFGRFTDLRSFMNVENLAEAVTAALASDARGAFVISDSSPLTVGDLYRKMLNAAGRTDRVWSLPTALVATITRLALGRRADSLVSSCVCEGRKFSAVAGWTPEHTLDEAIIKMVESLR